MQLDINALDSPPLAYINKVANQPMTPTDHYPTRRQNPRSPRPLPSNLFATKMFPHRAGTHITHGTNLLPTTQSSPTLPSLQSFTSTSTLFSTFIAGAMWHVSLFYQRLAILQNASSVTPLFPISLWHSPRTDKFHGIPLHQTLICIVPVPDTSVSLSVLPQTRSLAPPLSPRTYDQRFSQTLVESADRQRSSRAHSQPSPQSHCVLATALITGSVPFCSAHASASYKSKLTWFILFSRFSSSVHSSTFG